MRRPVRPGGRSLPFGARLVEVASTILAVGLLAALAAPVGAAPAGGPSVAARPTATPVRVDESAPPTASPGVGTVTTCGGYTVRVVTPEDGEDIPLPSLTVTAPDGTKVIDWSGQYGDEYAEVYWCRDVNGDGLPEIGYGISNGGHECCLTIVVWRLGGAGGELLRNVQSTYAAVLRPVQLDGAGPLELVTSDHRLDYWGNLSSLWNSPFPLIFAYRGGRYVEATKDFPAYLKADRKKAVKALLACPKSAEGDRDGLRDCKRAIGLHILAIDLMLGAPTSGISRLPTDLATRRWVLAQRAKVRKALAG